jgi:hypothetical protein
MKTKISLIIAPIIGMLLLMIQPSFAQCDTKTIRKSLNISLDDYIFESMAYKPYNEFKDKEVVRANFEVFRNEEYRLVDISEGFEGRVIINIYDPKGVLFLSNVYKNNSKIFDFIAQYSDEYMIEYIFDKSESKNPNNKCVAFGLGYK